MDESKQSLLNEMRTASTIPVESVLSPEADLSETSFSDSLGQLTELSERILEEVQETNRLYEEFFNPDNLEDKEASSEKQALRPLKDSSSELLSEMLGEIISVFAQLTAAVENMQNNGDGGGLDLDIGGGKKGGLKKFLRRFRNLKGTVSKILPTMGRLATRAAGPLAIAGGLGAAGKDAYDVATGSDGGANAKNIGGLIGSTVGAGIGVGLAALLGVGTGGAGLLAGGAIVGGASGIGNMIGEFIGGQFESTAQAETVNQPKQNSPTPSSGRTPYDGPSVRRAKPSTSGGGTPSSGSTSGAQFAPPPPSAPTVKPETAMVSEQGMMSDSPESIIPSSSAAYTPPVTSEESKQSRLALMKEEQMRQAKPEITVLPIQEIAAAMQQQSRPNVGPAGGSGLSVSEVPDPIYRGPALAIISEMYV